MAALFCRLVPSIILKPWAKQFSFTVCYPLLLLLSKHLDLMRTRRDSLQTSTALKVTTPYIVYTINLTVWRILFLRRTKLSAVPMDGRALKQETKCSQSQISCFMCVYISDCKTNRSWVLENQPLEIYFFLACSMTFERERNTNNYISIYKVYGIYWSI